MYYLLFKVLAYNFFFPFQFSQRWHTYKGYTQPQTSTLVEMARGYALNEN